MKKIITIISIVAFPISLMAQNVMINKKDSTITTLKITDIDSLSFTAKPISLVISKTDGTSPIIKISEIDSISITNSSLPSALQLNKSTVSLAKGGREKLFLSVTPSNSYVNYIKWSSANSKVASIDNNGIVTAVDSGKTIVSVSIGALVQQCTLEVVKSPITNLVMPEIKYPITNDTMIIIQGTGFTATDKIYLRKNNDLSSSLKSAQADGDILATIHQQAESYISFACSVQPAWYSVILDNDTTQFNLGNIKIETPPNIPAYSYDTTKMFWDDNHWRRFQLRGKVKQVNSIEDYLPYWTSKHTYTFNDKGYLKTFGKTGDSTHLATYEYDNFNRLINKSEKCNVKDGTGTFNQFSCQYSYGDHELYLPTDFSNEVQFEPGYSLSLYFDGEYQDMYNLEMWQKGIVGIKNVIQYTSGVKITQNYQFNISSNIITASYSNYKYKWNYKNKMPYEKIMTITYTSGTRTVKYNYDFTSNGIPVKNEDSIFTSYGDTITIPTKYIENAPYTLFSSYDASKGSGLVFNCKYDNNWNIISYDTKYDIASFYYNSYDDQGNWTQCTVVYKSKTGSYTSVHKLTRDITYW